MKCAVRYGGITTKYAKGAKRCAIKIVATNEEHYESALLRTEDRGLWTIFNYALCCSTEKMFCRELH